MDKEKANKIVNDYAERHPIGLWIWVRFLCCLSAGIAGVCGFGVVGSVVYAVCFFVELNIAHGILTTLLGVMLAFTCWVGAETAGSIYRIFIEE